MEEGRVMSLTKIGMAWLKLTVKQEQYLDGSITLPSRKKIYLKIFINHRKMRDQHPDYIIWKSIKDKGGKKKDGE